MLGKKYLIDYCLSCFLKEQDEKLFRAYVTDALRVLTENIAKISGGSYLAQRWIDMSDRTAKVDNRSADEIALDVIKKAGLSFGGDTE